jgi:cell division protein FtsZ
VNLTEGLGAGANPDVGQQSAIESTLKSKRCWIEIPRWFYHCRDGWWYRYRCGSSAQLAKEREILTVGIVTLPFLFEGKVRQSRLK